MPLPNRFLSSVYERDVDLLLLEELRVSLSFGCWFAHQAGYSVPEGAQLVGAWHSVATAHGESDLIAVWREPTGRRMALLIEDKIDACAQPEQGVRYLLRGEEGIAVGDWDLFQTCIFAPERYLDSSHDATEYGETVSYESARDWLDSQDDRAKHKAAILTAAIEQQRRGYSPEMDDHVTRFWRDFWLASRSRCPRLSMEDPGPKPAGSGWIWVRPSELGGKQWLGFKLDRGFVDLQVDGAAHLTDQLDAICRARLGGEIRAHRTGKSASIRIEVAPIDVGDAFAAQEREIEVALDAASTLLDGWKQVAEEIADSIGQV